MLFRILEKRPHFLDIKAAERRALFFAEQGNLRGSGDCCARAGANGGRSTQWNRGRSHRAQRREPAGALAFFARSLGSPKRTADQFDGTIGFFGEEGAHMKDFAVIGSSGTSEVMMRGT